MSFRRKPESILMQKDKTPAFHLLVIDGNQSENKKQRQNKWSTSRLPPAFAGMTNKTAPPCKDRSRPVGRPRGGIVPTDSPPRLVSFTNSRNQGFFNNPEKGAFVSKGAPFRCAPLTLPARSGQTLDTARERAYSGRGRSVVAGRRPVRDEGAARTWRAWILIKSAFVLIAYSRRRMTDETGKNIFIMISTGQRDFVADDNGLEEATILKISINSRGFSVN